MFSSPESGDKEKEVYEAEGEASCKHRFYAMLVHSDCSYMCHEVE